MLTTIILLIGIYSNSYCCRFLHAMKSNSNSYIVGNVICGYHLLFDWYLSIFNYVKFYFLQEDAD